MTTRTVTVYICDDCGGEFSQSLRSFKIDGDIIDLCNACMKDRIRYSFSICPNRKCSTCDGRGTVKQLVNNHDVERVLCNKCNGSRVLLPEHSIAEYLCEYLNELAESNPTTLYEMSAHNEGANVLTIIGSFVGCDGCIISVINNEDKTVRFQLSRRFP